MKKTRYTEEQIAFALKQAETGTRVEEVCRKMGISEATFYNFEHWRQEYNRYRPHSSLNNQTPEEFIRSLQTGPDL